MFSLLPKAGWMLAGVLALYVLSALAGVVTGGPLDPPGAPAPTLRSLGDIAPTWHRTLTTSGADACNTQRFTCVLGGAAALDNETGIVWERVPDATNRDWDAAYRHCAQRIIGARQGWRIPTLPELQSLLDGPALPSGHPFTTGAFPSFWTSSPSGAAPDEVYGVFFQASTVTDTRTTNSMLRAWCVRGVHGLDGAAAERRDDPFGSWDTILPGASSNLGNLPCLSARFRCVLGDTAVLDNETGLVWARAPHALSRAWLGAVIDCQNQETGGRGGWRLPEIEELHSLTQGLPANHPFLGDLAVALWSATTDVIDAAYANVSFQGDRTAGLKTLQFGVWCVRGGAGVHNW